MRQLRGLHRRLRRRDAAGQTPDGLIRLTSHEAVRTRPHPVADRAREGLRAVWLVLVVSVVHVARRATGLDVLILRQPGTLFTTLDNGEVANFYNLQVINRTSRPHALEYRMLSPTGATVTALGANDRVEPYGLVESRIMLQVPRASLAGATTPVRVEVHADGRLIETIASTFLGPVR